MVVLILGKLRTRNIFNVPVKWITSDPTIPCIQRLAVDIILSAYWPYWVQNIHAHLGFGVFFDLRDLFTKKNNERNRAMTKAQLICT